MAIIQSYPLAQATASDTVLGTQVDGNDVIRTVTYNIAQMNTLATQGFLETTITLTQAQMLALHTAAGEIQLLAPPSATKCYKLLAVSTCKLGGAFTGAQPILAQLNNVTQASLTTGTFTPAATTVSSITVPFINSAILAPGFALIASTAAAITGGTGGTYAIKIRYQVLDTSAF